MDGRVYVVQKRALVIVDMIKNVGKSQSCMMLDRELLDEAWSDCHRSKQQLAAAERAIATATTQVCTAGTTGCARTASAVMHARVASREGIGESQPCMDCMVALDSCAQEVIMEMEALRPLLAPMRASAVQSPLLAPGRSLHVHHAWYGAFEDYR